MADEDSCDGQGNDFDYYEEDDFLSTRPRRGSKRKPDPGFDLGIVEIVHETDNAIKVRGAGLSSDPFGVKDPNEEAWIPKSQIHPRSELQEDSGVGSKGPLVIAKWLAEKKGLV